MTTPKMTVGLAFDKNHEHLLMQLKRRPKHCAGRLNGPGGKQEVGESIVGCMVREFKEETTIPSTKDDWLYFHHERHVSGTDLYFFTTDKLDIQLAKSATDEPLVLTQLRVTCGFVDGVVDFRYMVSDYATSLDHLSTLKKAISNDSTTYQGLMYNMPYLIPMALVYLNHPEHRYLEG